MPYDSTSHGVREARRVFLRNTACSLGGAALGALLRRDVGAATEATAGSIPARGAIQPLHRPPRASRIIFLTMAGGPSHLETLDYKPKLAAMHGQPMPDSFTKGQPIAQLQGAQLKCFAPQHKF